MATTKFTTLSVEEFANRIDSSNVFLLDVRTPEEFKEGHIHGAHNLDVQSEDFNHEAVSELPKDKVIAVYCGSGRRSALAAEKLANDGFTVINLDGGLAAWKEAGFPVE